VLASCAQAPDAQEQRAAVTATPSPWTSEASGSNRDLLAVSVAGADVYAVGESGVILHRAGGAWSEEASGTEDELISVWAASPADAWAVSQTGLILHRTPAVGWLSEAPTQMLPLAVWGSGDDIWVVGSSILHHTSAGWITEASPLPDRDYLHSVWGSGADSVWAGGSVDGHVLHRTGGVWSLQSIGHYGNVEGLWGDDSNLWAVGRFSDSPTAFWGIEHLRNGTWTNEGGGALHGVWGSGNHVWTVGGYTPLGGPGGPPVGTFQNLLHRRDGVWVDEAVPSGSRLWGVAGNDTDAWAVGNNGTVLHRHVQSEPSPIGGACDAQSDCLAGRCDQGTCVCLRDTDCDAQSYCNSGACRAKVAGGGACNAANQCLPGYCAAGVCCGSACTGACEICDGSGTCHGCALDAFCYNGNLCIPRHCDAATTCPAGYFCDPTNSCQPLLADGSVSPAPADCASGVIADGVCCNRACGGGC
jgi:hypothetical protein